MNTQTRAGLDGRVAMVIGGSRGIGAAVVRRLAEDGAGDGARYITGASVLVDGGFTV